MFLLRGVVFYSKTWCNHCGEFFLFQMGDVFYCGELFSILEHRGVFVAGSCFYTRTWCFYCGEWFHTPGRGVFDCGELFSLPGRGGVFDCGELFSIPGHGVMIAGSSFRYQDMA